MKKLKFLIFFLSLGVSSIYATPIPQQKAATVAGNYFIQAYHTTANTLTLAYTELDSNGQPIFYVFNVNGDKGFVIVSAEDAGFPIIGSSNEGGYVIPTANSNVAFWMNNRKNEIVSMRSTNLMATAEVTAEWSSYINNAPINNSHAALGAVGPLCSTLWDQSPYYNALCPHGSVTGCVATTMAQIMKYWSYPSVGYSFTCYYDETSYGFTENYGQLCANFDTSHYNWAAMPIGKVTSANPQVAELMYDCGVSVNMNYSPSSSGAYVLGQAPSAINAWTQYFGYYQFTLQGVLESKYNSTNWINLIENEFNHNRPVQYQGTDSALQEGHSWVCDGYNALNQLHMNWGWSGTDDGYYSATKLAPAGSGFDFTSNLGAIIGIEPPSQAAGVAQVSTNTSTKVYPNPSNGVFNVEIGSVSGSPQIYIYNVLGQEVSSSKLNTLQTNINLSSQPKGVYIYKIETTTGSPTSTGRIIIQ